MDNLVAISKLLVLCNLPQLETTFCGAKKVTFAVGFWLSVRQLMHYFRSSGTCFGYPGLTDTQNFEC